MNKRAAIVSAVIATSVLTGCSGSGTETPESLSNKLFESGLNCEINDTESSFDCIVEDEILYGVFLPEGEKWSDDPSQCEDVSNSDTYIYGDNWVLLATSSYTAQELSEMTGAKAGRGADACS
jgi:hypothetical protein